MPAPTAPAESASLAFQRLGPSSLEPDALRQPALRLAVSNDIPSLPKLMVQEVPAINDDAVAKAVLALAQPSETSAPALEAVAVQATPRRFRWARNVLLGASVSFVDAGIAALKPLKFVWDNLPVVAQAIIYMALPLIPSFMLLAYLPALAEAFSPRTPIGALYLVGLYISSAFLLLLGAFSTSFCWRSGLRLMDHFARAGEEAFPRTK